MGETMWINKRKYEELQCKVKDNEHDAQSFRSLTKYIKEKKKQIVYSRDFVLVSRDTWDALLNKYGSVDVKVKDIEAELAWYKVKYHEMKMHKST